VTIPPCLITLGTPATERTMIPDESLLNKLAVRLSQPPAYAEQNVYGSILTASAALYGRGPSEPDLTQPTGFDPEAAALFEAVVESAYLVGNADGEFDERERKAFQHVVVAACQGAVAERQVEALLADLGDQLAEDGIDKRLRMVARTVTKPDHQREVLRVAALLAHVSGGVSKVERDVLEQLTREFDLEPSALELALGEAERVTAD
jgi:tellurite resistance protein